VRRVGFEAHLEQVTLPDVVQMECLSGSERSLRVVSNGRTGYLLFAKGKLVHALTPRLRGEAAAIEILSWKEGTVAPAPMQAPALPIIQKPWQQLLLEVARLEDEARAGIAPEGHAQGAPYGSALEPLSPSAPAPEAVQKLSERPAGDALLRLARVDASGSVVSARGGAAAAGLGETAAYSMRLAKLVGEALGLEGPAALEWCFAETQVLVYYEQSGNLTALEASLESNLSSIRKKVGL
jgi:hypothetical protein